MALEPTPYSLRYATAFRRGTLRAVASGKEPDMKPRVYVLMAAVLAVIGAGCVETGPVITKAEQGNLQIEIVAPKDTDLTQAEIYLDGVFVGNVSSTMPVLHARRGVRTIRVLASGYKPYEKQITILGEPNHQVLNVKLEKE